MINNVTTLPKAGKVISNKFIIRVPLLYFKTTSNIILVNKLQKLNCSE